jgi:hypothetical protein
VDQAELYDPATDSFTAAWSVSRDFHTATLLNTGDVLLAGGEVGWANLFPVLPNSAELAGRNASYLPTGSMFSGRESHTATLLKDGRIGGANSSDGFASQSFPHSSSTDDELCRRGFR